MNENFLDQAMQALEAAGDESARVRGHLLAQRISNPAVWVVLVGETSSGKSTLLNALLKSPVLPVRAIPTTGTLIQILFEASPADTFRAVYMDATQLDLTLQEFQDAVLKPSPDLLRLQMLTSRGGSGNTGMELFDTPGYNSEQQSHETILRSILPESDAIVFVAGYMQGFGQADQELYETASQSIAGDPDTPLFLVINRVPPTLTSGDRRVQEILHHAQDSLRGAPLHLHLVSEAPGNPRTAEGLPATDPLWQDVRASVLTPERQVSVRMKLDDAFRVAMADALRMVEINLDAMQIRPEEQEEVRQKVAGLREARRLSIAAIDEAFLGLSRSLPRLLVEAKTQIMKGVTQEVETSGRWNDGDSCRTFIQHHYLEFYGRQMLGQVEGELTTSLLDLDRKLNDLGNTAVANFRRPVRLPSEALARLLENTSITLSRRIAGEFALSGLKKLGGVGGEAAGMGNAVKMLAKKAGNLFDTTFSRRFYARIGELFDKRLARILGVTFAVAVEGALVAWDVYRWKAQLLKLTGKGLDQWVDDIQTELISEMLPEIKAYNCQGIQSWYDDLIANLEANLVPTDNVKARQLEDIRDQLVTLLGAFHESEAC